MKPFKIFIDTEYTSFIDTGLISLGLVVQSGEEAYFEVEYNKIECSDFVCEVVIPLLDGEPQAMVPKHELAAKLATWLGIVRHHRRDIEICYDHQTDWDLFIEALNYRVPSWVISRNVCYEVGDLLYQEFFVTEGQPEHHVLYDARANAYTFRERVVE